MSKKTSQVPVEADIAAQQALALFEESLTLLEGNTHSDDEVALPFSSLLEQCEAILKSTPKDEAPLYILFTMPGVPALALEWWAQHFSGLIVRQVTSADNNDPGFHAWTKAVQESGQPLLLTTTPEVILPDGITADATALVVCHPYRAFCSQSSRTSITLNSYCTLLLSALDRLPNMRAIRMEEFDDPATGLSNALQLPPSVTQLLEQPYHVDDTIAVPPYFEGGPAYENLCSELGYDERTLPKNAFHKAFKPPETYHCENSGSRSKSPAMISGFLDRATNVRHALNPESEPLQASTIVSVLDACADAREENFLDLFDQAADQLGQIDRTLAYLAAAAHFHALGDRLSALNFTGNAQLHAPRGISWLNVLITAAYADLNDSNSAVMALASDALAPDVLEQSVGQKLNAIVSQAANSKATEHGHVLLLDALNALPLANTDRQRVLIEIGTTRELVLGQGSTQKIAELCAEYGFMFITVDMDPRNTRNAARMFAREGYDFQAITSKGEDFLAQYEGIIDYVFLDAYDFDHGKHSEIRQDRYERFLGSRIEEEQCQQMHLDCVQSLVSKIAPDGLICFDDTWTTPEGGWAAKGATAMPFLLNNGYVLIEAHHRAALLKRG